MARDYKKEYNTYHSSSEQKKNRAKRNSARKEMAKAGRVAKGDGMEVDHKLAIKNGGGNSKENLRVVDKKKNRGWRKGKTGYTP